MNFKKYLEQPDKKNSNFLLSPYFVNDKLKKERSEKNKKIIDEVNKIQEIFYIEEQEKKAQEDKNHNEEIEKIKTNDVFKIITPEKQIDYIEELNNVSTDEIDSTIFDILKSENENEN